MMDEGVVLGHYFSTIGITLDPTKIQFIINQPPPQKLHDVKSFIGQYRYYQRFIPD